MSFARVATCTLLLAALPLTASAFITPDAWKKKELPALRVIQHEGARWVFEEGSEAHEKALKGVFPDKHVTGFETNAAGAFITKAPSRDLLASFRARRPGYRVVVVDGQHRILPAGAMSSELPEKHVTRLVNEGGQVAVYKAADKDTLTGYLESKPGYACLVHEGRRWILASGSKTLDAALAGRFPDKHVSRIVSDGDTVRVLKSPDRLTLTSYLESRPGHSCRVSDEGHLWLFREGSAEETAFDEGHRPDKHVTRMVSDDGHVTVLKAVDRHALDGWFAARPGFVLRQHDDRTWVLPEGSLDLARFAAGHVPEKHVTRIVSTQGGILSLKFTSAEVLRAWEASKRGFVNRLHEGQIWVFREGSPALAAFDEGAVPDKHATRLRTDGGHVISMKSPEAATLDAWEAAPGWS
ncbi:MAG: hypothetical protein AAF533_08100 [Acidobacteriota bacterium]